RHRAGVVEVEVVWPDRGAHVVGRAVVYEIAGRGEDRRVRVHDVAALPVVGPRRGQELHGTHRTRRRWTVDAAEVALDEVDRCEVARVDSVPVLRLEVIGPQRAQRRGGGVRMREVHVDQVVLVDAGEDVQRVQSRDGVAHRSLYA